MKQAIITLHYKGKGDHRLLKNWRPISLLCTDYKIISKVISNRIKTVVNKLISELQTGAGKNKSILDNLINIDSIINYIEIKQLGAAIISFDQEKAFDRVEHNYLLSVLEAYNFPNNIVKWIKILYTNITSSILINGKISKSFNVTRSVRQGCPLSMTLYALAIEPLANYIKSNNNIKGIKIPNCNDEIKLFQHADDCNTIITTEISYDNIINEFDKFSKASGSKINDGKTEILPLGTWKNKVLKYDRLLIKKQIKVLGVWFGEDKINKNWDRITTIIEKLSKTWKERKLNNKSKLNIINSIILSKAWYVARIVKPTDEHIKRMNRAIFTFYWNNNYEYIARKTLMLTLEQGGVKFPDIKTKINAMYIQRITKTCQNNDKYWKTLLIYWIGLTIGTIKPEFKQNTIIHTEILPQIYIDIRRQFLQYKDDINWNNDNLKIIYWTIKNTEKYTPEVMKQPPPKPPQHIWRNIRELDITEQHKHFIYTFLHRGLHKKYIDFKCNKCQTTRVETYKHIFIFCPQIQGFKEFCKLSIMEKYNIILNENTILYLDTENKQILKEIFKYIYTTWEVYKLSAYTITNEIQYATIYHSLD